MADAQTDGPDRLMAAIPVDGIPPSVAEIGGSHATMKHIIYIVMAGIALVLAGCSTVGLPRKAHVVGGGSYIRWNPPANGTVYLVEATTRTIIATEDQDKGDTFRFDMSEKETQEAIKAALPVMRANPRFVLYFLPSHD